jgi:hypothetical protein
MSIKSKVFASAAALTLAGTMSAIGMTAAVPGANAATPSCGKQCIDLYSLLFGTHAHPNYVFDVYKQSAETGQPIILWQASNFDQAEDFSVTNQGTVEDLYEAGEVTAALNLHYHSLQAFEIQYSPYGAESGYCIGVGTTAADGTKVSLRPCGESSKTIWVVDSFSAIKGAYVPLINGSDINFSSPYVLNYPSSGYPTDSPRPQLQTWTLQKFTTGATADNELFSADFGVIK